MSKPSLPSLWPREHGAYAQLGVALAAGFALAPSARNLGQGILTGTLFLGSEPLLVLLGRRGDQPPGMAGRAWGRLGLLGTLAVGAGTEAWLGTPVASLGSLLPAAILGVGLFGLFLAHRERTPAGEVLAAWAFAASALPMALAGLFIWRFPPAPRRLKTVGWAAAACALAGGAAAVACLR